MSKDKSVILITGATGKVGQNLIRVISSNKNWGDSRLKVLCHNRKIDENKRINVVNGSIVDHDTVKNAMEGVTHVVHLATCKENQADIMDISVKGLFWLLEESRISSTFRQFILVGGDASMGHFFHQHPIPIVENQKYHPYSGCYALSKVLEEVMLEQYYTQYNLNGCCLRAPWIMEKDDFKYSLSFGEDVFGSPKWCEYVTEDKAKEYVKQKTIPIMLDRNNQPVLRNFVHVEDLCSAMISALDNPNAHQELFNICMDEPINYREVAVYLKKTKNLPSVELKTLFFSNWLDNSKAKFLLKWRPKFNMEKLIDSAWSYKRDPSDPRQIWYPG